MTGMLISRRFVERFGASLDAIEARHGVRFERIHPPQAPEGRLDAEQRERIEIGYMSGDLFPVGVREYFIAALQSPNLRWLQGFMSGTDSAAFDPLIERGVTLTNAAGCTAVPIAQTALGALLMLSRGFLHWSEAQRARQWSRLSRAQHPEDLSTQTIAIVGLGSIGLELARLTRALGMHVIGLRRTPAAPGDPIDEWLPPARLAEALPRAHWLAICCPLTAQTRGVIDARALALLPPGARLLNVARGPIVVESDLVAALQSGRLGGAYLDVFEIEPLPAESPLWTLPNVIVTPHDSAASAGNDGRGAQVFLDNLERWIRKEPLANVVSASTRG